MVCGESRREVRAWSFGDIIEFGSGKSLKRTDFVENRKYLDFILKNGLLKQYNIGSTLRLIRQFDIKEIEIIKPPNTLRANLTTL